MIYLCEADAQGARSFGSALCTRTSPELRYSHVEKLALAAVYAVHRLRHYILLRTTTVVVDVNPFQYVLSR